MKNQSCNSLYKRFHFLPWINEFLSYNGKDDKCMPWMCVDQNHPEAPSLIPLNINDSELIKVNTEKIWLSIFIFNKVLTNIVASVQFLEIAIRKDQSDCSFYLCTTRGSKESGTVSSQTFNIKNNNSKGRCYGVQGFL